MTRSERGSWPWTVRGPLALNSASGLEIRARCQAFRWLLLTWAPRGLLGGAEVARGDRALAGLWEESESRRSLFLLPSRRPAVQAERTVMCVRAPGPARTPRLGWEGLGTVFIFLPANPTRRDELLGDSSGEPRVSTVPNI